MIDYGIKLNSVILLLPFQSITGADLNNWRLVNTNKQIQVLRGLAIIAVVFIHTNIGGFAGVVTRPFLNFAVAMFIFLSGYLTKLNIPDTKSFYKKRLIKILVPYTIWSIIYTACSGTWDGFVQKFFTAQCCSVYYYIFIYALFVLLTPLISKLIQSKYSWIGWVITPVSLLLTRYITAFTGMSLPSELFSFLFTNWFIFYYLGMCLGNKKINYNTSTAKTAVFLFVSLTLSILEGSLWFKFGNYDMATTQLRFTSMLTSLSTMLLSYKYLTGQIKPVLSCKITAFISRVLVCIGDCSFGIYLSHILIMRLWNTFIVTNLPFPLHSILIIAISTCCVLIGKKILTKKFSWLLGL